MAGRSPVYAPNGVAATSQPLATTAAIRVLQNGGNAIDAAVTAAAVLSVVEPMMTGSGGDMFAIIWSAKEKHLVALNASGRAGSLMTREELVKRGRTRIPRGVETVTVPGALAGWDALLKKYGTITLAQARAAGDRIRGERIPRHARDLGRLGAGGTSLAADEGGRSDLPASTATRRSRVSGSAIPTTRTRCARSPRMARAPSTAARLARSSSRTSRSSAASSRSTISSGISRPG